MSCSIAVIWQRFGPYHVARLQGASEAFGRHGWNCVGIEVAGRDQYAWDEAGGERRTLFPNARYESLSRRRIQQATNGCLDDLQPEAVAVNGWSVPEALAATDWCRRNNRPAILMSETHQGSKQKWKEWVKRQRVGRCRAALVGGRWHATYLASLGFPRDRIVVGYDAVDNEHFRAGAEEARNRTSEAGSQNGLPEHYFYANTRFLPRKNIDGLLRAYAEYRGKGSGVFCRNGPMHKRVPTPFSRRGNW